MVFILGEGVLIFCAAALAALFLLENEMGSAQLLKAIWAKVLLVAIVTQISLYFNDLYEFKPEDDPVEMAMRLIQSIGVTSILLAVIYYLFPGVVIGRWVFFASLVVLVLFLVSWRVLYAYVLRKRLFAEKVMLIGDGDLAKDIMEEIKTRREIIYDIRLVVGREKKENNLTQFDGIPIRYGFDEICDLAEGEQTSSVIVALDEKRGIMPYDELLNCKTKGISIIDGESFYERITGKLLLEKIHPSWFIFSDGFEKSLTSKIMKRVVGLVISGILLFIFSPLILLTAITIKLDSPGPILFSQERVGKDGKVFKIHKFRSMIADAEKATGPVWASEHDPRITRVGKIIRKLRFDELPQLFNVLKGDISFVGPRPERAFFVEKLLKTIPYYKERFTVKPGVTGWAQIKYPYGATEKDALEKLKYDLYYIKNMSFIMDLMVVFHTVKTVLLGRGSR